ncbi:MAG: restriction endonuclease subunit S [Nautiliaceae bacterium]
MSEWKEVKLGEFIKVQGGYAFKSRDFLDKGIPIVKIKNLVNNKIDLTEADYVNEEFLKIAKNYIINHGDVLISMTGSNVNQSNSMVGKVAYVNKNIPVCLLNQRVGRLILKNNNIELKYIFYFLSQKEVQYYLASNASGSANQANINASIIENLKIPYKDYVTTKKIADMLSIIDEKIETLQNINETLEEMAKAIFKSWFVDFDIVKAKEEGKSDSEIAKEFGISEYIIKLFPSEFMESEIGKIPKGWEVVYLKDEFKFERGVEPGSKFYFENPTEEEIKNKNLIPFYRVKDLETKANVYIPTKVSKNKISKFGEVLVSFDGTIGRVSAFLNGSYSSGIRKITAKNYSNAFIYFLMQSDYIQDLIKQYATGTTILHAGKSINYLYLVKNEDVIREYEKFTIPIFDEILNNTQQIQTLQELRDTLLPKLINGEIEVDELDIKGIENGLN